MILANKAVHLTSIRLRLILKDEFARWVRVCAQGFQNVEIKQSDIKVKSIRFFTPCGNREAGRTLMHNDLHGGAATKRW
jgi:hypothetical protein